MYIGAHSVSMACFNVRVNAQVELKSTLEQTDTMQCLQCHEQSVYSTSHKLPTTQAKPYRAPVLTP